MMIIFVIIKIGLPLVSVGGKKYISKYSHQITLTTVVKADPPVKFVYWEKVFDGRRTILNNGAVGTLGSSPNNPSLTLEYSTKADIGTYRCFATNDVGTGRGDIISLQVTGGNKNSSFILPIYTSLVSSSMPTDFRKFVLA